MRIRVVNIEHGMHPSERVVEIQTSDGLARVAVDSSYLRDHELEVGNPISRINGSRVLVELPRETFTGKWRVWVDAENVVEGAA